MRNLLALLVLFWITACNQHIKNSDEINNDEVAFAVKTLNNNLVNPEKTALQHITAEGLTYGHSSGLIQNREEFIDDLINGPFNFIAINTSDQNIHFSGNVAIVRHILMAKGVNKEGELDVKIGVILVFQKQNREVKLLARQAYRL